jgi:hypothetical protein
MARGDSREDSLKPSIGAILIGAALVVLGTEAGAAIIPTAPLEVVVPRTDHIVRGTVDFEKRTVTIAHRYRGEIGDPVVRVANLRIFGPSAGPFSRDPDTAHPKGAILFLQELDGRYYLVHERVPEWIEPHSSAYYLSEKGPVQTYLQNINPGPVCLTDRYPNLAAFEEHLAGLLARTRPRPDRRGTSLNPEELDRFYETISPYVDYYRREVVRPGEALAHWNNSAVIDGRGEAELELFAEKLCVWVKETEGEARARGIEALLMLAEQSGPDQARRRHVQARLLALLGETGAEPFVPVLHAELASRDSYANRQTAAALLRRIGGPDADRAEAILRKTLLATWPGTVSTRCYWALRYLGREETAEKVRVEAERRRADREGGK